MRPSYIFAALLLVCLCFLAFGDSSSFGEIGRYQITANDNSVFLVDTTDGRTWKSQASGSRDWGNAAPPPDDL